MDPADCVVVMGVAGSGKTTVGAALAQRLDRAYLDADDLHSAASIAKMRRGIPLEDQDRTDWLLRVREWIRERRESRQPSVVSCSALRRRYRDTLRTAGDHVRFCHLTLPDDELAARLEGRTDHFLPPTLLTSQLATLEGLEPDEPGLVVDGRGSVDEVVARSLTALGLDSA